MCKAGNTKTKWCDETFPTAIFALTYESCLAADPKTSDFLSLTYWDSFLFDSLTHLCWPSWRTGAVVLYGLFSFLWRVVLKVFVIFVCTQPQWLSAAFRICLGSTSAAPSETWPTRTLKGRGMCKEFPRSANAGAAAGDASTPTFL